MALWVRELPRRRPPDRRVMGLILAAVAVHFVFSGIKEAFGT
jgi:hypothetical protein